MEKVEENNENLELESVYDNPWVYNNSIFSDDMIEDNIGFVYEIFDTINNKRYIGKKQFYSSKIIPATKGTKNHPARKKKKTKINSNWKEYYGSNEILQNEVTEKGIEHFNRKILYLCKGLAEMSYKETREILIRDALIKNDYYNSWIKATIQSNQLKKIWL